MNRSYTIFTLLLVVLSGWHIAGKAQTITTFAGGGLGDGAYPLSAWLRPFHITLHHSDLYIADATNARIRKVDTLGTHISTVAGNRYAATSAIKSGQPATATSLAYPCAVAFDSHDNMYIVDNGASDLLMVDTAGILTKIAGLDSGYYNGDNIPATAAALNEPFGLWIDKNDDIYIVEGRNSRVRKISGGIITTIAGGGTTTVVDSITCPATAAQLLNVYDLAPDGRGGLYLGGVNQLLHLDRSGMISTFTTQGSMPYLVDDIALATDNSGNVYMVQDYIYKIDTLGHISIYDTTKLSTSDYVGLAVREDGKMYIARFSFVSLGLIVAKDHLGKYDTLAGNVQYLCDGTQASEAGLFYPATLAHDTMGSIYIGQPSHTNVPARISKVDKNGIINSLVSTFSFSDFCAAPNGDIYWVFRASVYKRSANGDSAVVAGTGENGYSGDGGPATAAMLKYSARGLCLDNNGNLYILDGGRIRKVNTNGIISTYAGNGSTGVDAGNGGPATDAVVSNGNSIAADKNGNIYILCNGYIRKIDTNGIIDSLPVTVSADGLPFRTNAGNRITCDTAGNIYYTDAWNSVYKIDQYGVRHRIAGIDTIGFNGEYGQADTIALNIPRGITIDDSGRVYIADYNNSLVRRIDTRYRFAPPPLPGIDSSGAVHIYPNPATSQVKVQFYCKAPGDAHIQLYDAVGKRAMDILVTPVNGVVDKTIVLPSSMPPGVYLLSILSPSVNKTQQLVIAR